MSVEQDVFRDQPVLHGKAVRLEPLGMQHFEGIMELLTNRDGLRMTATDAVFEEEMARGWVSTRQDHDDRADFAIVRQEDGEVLGEVVLNELDTDNACVNFRIGLKGPQVYGRGYGTEAAELVLDYAFDTAGLHRVELEVYSFNPRAQRSYEKAGFAREGVRRQGLWWEERWHDVVLMAMLATDPRPWQTRR